MVKFHNPADSVFATVVAPDIKKLIYGALDRMDERRLMKDVKARPHNTRAAPRPKIRGLSDPTMEMDTLRDQNASIGKAFESYHVQYFDPVNSIKERVPQIIDDLLRRHESLQPATNIATEGTCEWILKNETYQDWRDAPRNSVLFIEGNPGWGKSVLARFILKNLRKDGKKRLDSMVEQEGTHTEASRSDTTLSNGPIVAHFLNQKQLRDSSAQSILMEIAAQICTIDPRATSDICLGLLHRFGATVDFQFLWSFLKGAPKHMKRDIYCVVDGLDECIDKIKTHQAMPGMREMEEFLREVTVISDLDEDPNENLMQSSRLKVLFTTQPKGEIDLACQGKNLQMRIRESDIRDDVAKMVEHRVKELAIGRNFPEDNRAFTTVKVIEKCSPIFQMAHQLLEELKRDCHLDNQDEIGRRIEAFRSQKLESVYEGYLEKIPPRDHGTAGKVIRLLYFSYWTLSVEELSHALAVRYDDPSEVTFQERLRSGAIDFFRRRECGSLVRIEDTGDILLDHPSVYRFFGSLRGNRWTAFSCAHSKEGHLQLALICVRYLMLWRHVSPELRWADENFEEILDKNSFAHYAANCWTFHIQECEELIVPHLDLLRNFLDLSKHREDYIFMLFLRHIANAGELDEFPEFKGIPPDKFVVENKLFHLLPIYYHPSPVKPRRKFCLLKRKNQAQERAGDNLINSIDWSSRSALHYACENGDERTVRYLLQCGAVGNIGDANGETPFSVAVSSGNEKIAELLLEHDLSYERGENEKKLTILHLACSWKMENIVLQLLANARDPNAVAFDGWTPVHVAATTGSLLIMHMLLNLGGKADIAKDNGDTPLYLAAGAGFLEIVKHLFQTKSDLDPVPRNKSNQTPLFAAARNGHQPTFQYLLEKERNVPPDIDGWLPVHIAATRGHLDIVRHVADSPNLQARTNTGRQPLHLAASGGHLKVLRFFIEELQVDPDSRCEDLAVDEDNEGPNWITPIYLAATSGHHEIVKYLLSRGVDLRVKDRGGRRLQHAIARKGTSDLLNDLHLRGLDMMARTASGLTPFHFAACGQPSIVNMYIEGTFGSAVAEQFRIDDQGTLGITALQYAVEGACLEIVEYLLAHGADPSLGNLWGLTPLVIAARLKKPDILRLLLQKNVNPNQATVGEKTALHIAACYGNSESLKLLIGKNADINATCANGLTPLLEAASHFQTETFAELLKVENVAVAHRDRLGKNAFDYVRGHPQLMDLLQPWKHEDQEMLEMEKHKLLYQHFLELLEGSTPPKKDNRLQCEIHRKHLQDLGTCYLALGNFDAARIIMESFLVRLPNGGSYCESFSCDLCYNGELEGPIRICKICPDNAVCQKCYDSKPEKRPPGCAKDHEQIVLGGESWTELKGKEVDKNGQSFETWLEKQRGQYLPSKPADAPKPSQATVVQHVEETPGKLGKSLAIDASIQSSTRPAIDSLKDPPLHLSPVLDTTATPLPDTGPVKHRHIVRASTWQAGTLIKGELASKLTEPGGVLETIERLRSAGKPN